MLWIGGVPVGSAHPIVVQSMTNTDTADVQGTVRQVAALARAISTGMRDVATRSSMRYDATARCPASTSPLVFSASLTKACSSSGRPFG